MGVRGVGEIGSVSDTPSCNTKVEGRGGVISSAGETRGGRGRSGGDGVGVGVRGLGGGSRGV